MYSVAVYQAAILCSQRPETSPESVAQHVLSGVRRWRRIPDATILLTGDFEECARRFADRIGLPLPPADLQLLEQIDTLYRMAAADDPRRARGRVSSRPLGKRGSDSAAGCTPPLAALVCHMDVVVVAGIAGPEDLLEAGIPGCLRNRAQRRAADDVGGGPV